MRMNKVARVARIRHAVRTGEFGRMLRAAELSHQDVATALGVTRAAVWGWAHGRSRPSVEHAERIAELLDELGSLAS